MEVGAALVGSLQPARNRPPKSATRAQARVGAMALAFGLLVSCLPADRFAGARDGPRETDVEARALPAPAAVASAPAERHEGSRDPASYIEMLERSDRAAYQKPAEVVAALELRPGDVVADIGAGSGYFTLRLARAVAPNGKVYAEDVWQAMIDHIGERAAREGIANVELVLGLPADPKLAPRSIDLAFICNTWHHIQDHASFLEKLASSLKPGGRVAIVDYRATKTPVGPPLEMRVPQGRVAEELSEGGFGLLSQSDILPYQYFLIFKREER